MRSRIALLRSDACLLLGAILLSGCADIAPTSPQALALGTRKFLRELPDWRRQQILDCDPLKKAEEKTPAVSAPPAPAGGSPATPAGVGAVEPAVPLKVADIEEAFRKLYAEKAREDRHLLDLEKEIAAQHADRYGWLTRTTAAVVFVPELRAAQPALVQSFSLRNFFQSLSPSSDPENIQHQVEKDVAQPPELPDAYRREESLLLKKTSCLRPEEYDALVHWITDEVVKDNWWFSRTNIPSVDLGLAGFTIGTSGDKFDEEVDTQFPQFLFGLGLHFGSFEATGGAMLYRDNTNDFEVTGFFGFSIELYKTLLGAPAPTTPSATTAPST